MPRYAFADTSFSRGSTARVDDDPGLDKRSRTSSPPTHAMRKPARPRLRAMAAVSTAAARGLAAPMLEMMRVPIPLRSEAALLPCARAAWDRSRSRGRYGGPIAPEQWFARPGIRRRGNRDGRRGRVSTAGPMRSPANPAPAPMRNVFITMRRLKVESPLTLRLQGSSRWKVQREMGR